MTRVVISGPKQYDLVYVDPPWSYFGSGTKMGAAGKHYSLMTQDDLKNLDIRSILNKKAMVLMWATGPRLDYAIDLIRAWGLHYRGIAYVWVKTTKAGKIISGQGVPPTFTKPTTEVVLCATTIKAGRPLPLKRFNGPQVVLAPRGKHSQKPDVFRKEIEQTLGHGISKLEMFAREVAPGWDAVGNELCYEDISVSIGKLNGTVPFTPVNLALASDTVVIV